MTDEQLMVAYQKGDVEAFAELARRHEKPLWNFLRRFVSDAATAEDLMQEALLRVVRARLEWQPSARFSTWLYTIARNLCTDHARRMSLRRAGSLDGQQMATDGGDGDSGPRRIDGVPSSDPGAEAVVRSREIAARIEAALASLPVEQREVFLMRETMDLSFSEIARAVGVSEPTVKSRMRYALVRLREALIELRDSGRHPAVGVENVP